MSTLKNIALTDYVDVLNDKSNEISKYEGFYPDKYLIDNSDASKMVLSIVPTNGEATTSQTTNITISKLSPYDKNWFEHAAEAQVAVYQSVLDVLKDINKDNKFYTAQSNGKFTVASKKTNSNNVIQQELALIELNAFNTLADFRNYSLADAIKPKKDETLESVKDKTTKLVDSIRDSIARLRFIDGTPDFSMSAVIKDDSITFELALDDKKLLSFENDWKTIDYDLAYNRTVALCNASRVIGNTLKFYQDIVGVTEPKLYVSKLFSKKWKITKAGQQYMTCLEINNLVKEDLSFNNIK